MAVLRLQGSRNLRQRLVSATLAGRALRIDDIRSEANPPGLRAHEVSLLRLLEKVSNGCAVEINETGTKLRYRPGVVLAGSNVSHDCGTSRAIGYFVEPLIFLGLFAKKPLSITLKGVTSDDRDVSVDAIRAVTLPILKRFGVDVEEVELKIVRRGSPPTGGGEVRLSLPLVATLEPVSWTDEGLVKRVRGVAHSCRVSPQMANRMVDAARGVLNRLLADVYIFTDHRSAADSGSSPGYGISLVAETTTGCVMAAESALCVCTGGPGEDGDDAEGIGGGGGGGGGGRGKKGDEQVVPEDLGLLAARTLLHEVDQGGVVDSGHQAFVFLLCALGPEEISTVRCGPLTPQSIVALRDIRDILGVRFDVRSDESTGTVFLSCIGCGLKNRNKPVS